MGVTHPTNGSSTCHSVPVTDTTPIDTTQDDHLFMPWLDEDDPNSSNQTEEITQSHLMPSSSYSDSTPRPHRTPKIPTKFNDYVLEGKYKYGIEKTVSYFFLNKENKCFISNLNKTLEPQSYLEACTDPNWIKAINDEMEALYRNNTWDITDFPKDRKSIGCRWIYKIKYKSNG